MLINEVKLRRMPCTELAESPNIASFTVRLHNEFVLDFTPYQARNSRDFDAYCPELESMYWRR